ncbi:hypothetical protein ASPVEDRAFT_63482 [Aspergillus versicolor CBS 583.65]|uniref:DUF7587 domain-containing protein n=1 Tax=Aspergillus versicolor CBS 583.65 TaxID=1036611 RepID=A0A1L9PR00_ASPVE|nr:uncharacterized protein ASPVEDRAFT_63482 [Aspergillus versicolor CBS 583.65]OJJ03950.1 hypothetical protein ASPVEDRAFT_63482 [Aspergillus versicolor CBS 583.65]
MNGLTDHLSTIHIGDEPEVHEPEVPDQLIFNPQDDSGLDPKALDNIPRYLFRIVSPESDGHTDSTWVHSRDACDNTPSSTEDIFSGLDDGRRGHIAWTLNRHLRWWPKDDRGDNYVSWTTSLLFAIQYIYYRHQHHRDQSSLEDIDLYVVDTAQFPRGTFLRDLDLMEAFHPYDTHPEGKNLDNFLELRKKPRFYFGEYLSQGSLKIEGKCQRISAAALFENNALYRLQPQFGDISNPPDAQVFWVKEVNRIRDAVYQLPERLSMQEMRNRLQAVGELAAHFPPGWQFPLAIYFAGLISDDSVTEEEEIAYDSVLFAYFRSQDFYGGHKHFGPRRFKVVAHASMPELQRVEELVREINKDSRLRMALDRLQRAEIAIQGIGIIIPFPTLDDSFSVSDSNAVLARAGNDVLSTVESIRQLCDQLVQTIKPNNQQQA